MKTTVARVGLLLSVSCGAGERSAGEPIPLERMSAELKKAVCDKIYSCCSAADRMGNDAIGTDSQSCQNTLSGEVTMFLGGLQTSIAEGRVAYRADKLASCLAEIRARSCDQVKMPADENDLTDLCAGVLEPKVPVGGGCSYFWDCTDGWCAGDLGGLKDNCVPRGAEGTPCDEGVECASGICSEDRACVKRAAGSGNVCKLGMTLEGQHTGARSGRWR